MELLTLFLAPLTLLVLAAMAARFGHDSRDPCEAPPQTWLGPFR